MEDFYVVAREAGQERIDLPTWACARQHAVTFDASAAPVRRADIDGVPGAFQLLGVLSDAECDQFVAITETLGYHTDAPVTLPYSVRHMCNVNWVVDESVDGPIWARCRRLVPPESGAEALGINARFRCYRYAAGDYFKPHTDGAWPGSRVVDGELVWDAYGDRYSRYTFLILLSDGYEGGRTLFYTGADAEQVVAVHTPKGGVLCFPHGNHPLHCLHAGEQVTAGRKYMIRTEVLFRNTLDPG